MDTQKSRPPVHGLSTEARLLAGLFAAFAGATGAMAAPVGLAAFGAAYTENFDTLATTGFSSALPAGWAFAETGSNANSTFLAGTGSSNAGDTYGFGAAGGGERAFGTLRSGSLIATIGASFVNNAGSILTSLEISYTGERWRLGSTGRPDRLDFQYSLDAGGLDGGTWVDFDALDFVAPASSGAVGARDGNSAANRAGLSATLSGLSIGSGQSFWIRWSDYDALGADDGLGVDDFALIARGNGAEPSPVPEPATLALLGLGLAGIGCSRRRLQPAAGSARCTSLTQ